MRAEDRPSASLRLRPDLTLLLEEGACLPLRSVYGACRACADACPVHALSVSVEAVALSGACTGCGRCSAACPTQALMLPELAALDDTRATDRTPLRVECRKVPAPLHHGETLIVPCLGALTPGHLMARAAAAVDVQVVDRGWCRGCESGCNDSSPKHPAMAAIEAATAWSAAAGADHHPILVSEPLPPELRPTVIPPAPEAGPAVDRRRFFRVALDRPAGRARADAMPMGGDGRAACPADARRASPERERQRHALARMTFDRGHDLPAEFFPQLHADARCCDRRMCVALCPTAALSVADDGASSHLQWSSDRCIACGTCVRACPEATLSLSPHGGSAGVQTLASHPRARCTSCGDAFTPRDETADTEPPALCPTCAKSRRFIDDARRQLFGALN